MKNYRVIFSSAALLLVAKPVSAEAEFNSFTSVYTGATLANNTFYGYRDQSPFHSDSFATLRATANLTEALSVTAQVFAQGPQAHDGELAWAYGVNEIWEISSGHLRVPMGLSLDLTRDWGSVRARYTIAEFSVVTVVEPLQPLYVGDDEAVSQTLVNQDDGYVGSVGVFIDYNDWLMNAERVQFEPKDNLVIKTDAYYLMLGKRLGAVTVAYTFSGYEHSNDFSMANVLPGASANLRPANAPLCGASAREFVRNCVLLQENDSTAHNMTLRWNFHPAAAFTVDYTEEEVDKLNGFMVDNTNKLITMGVDLIF